MQKVLITGGNKGIGLEITKLFAANGHKVIIIARDFSDFPIDLADKTTLVEFDLERIEDIPKLIEEIGAIDVLINNAAILNSIAYDAYDETLRRKIIRVNLEAPVQLITEVSKGMSHRKYGRIVNISSIAGEIGQSDIWYAITKAGVINFTKSFAKLIGPDGISINCIAPGPVDTEMFKLIPHDRQKRVLDRTITGRPASPEEVAKTAHWLAADAPQYINGVCIDVNNGATLR